MFSWASGNYPAGAFAWSSTPYQVNPNYRAFTPGQAPSAQEMNYLFSQMATASVTGVTVPGAGWNHGILRASVLAGSVFGSAYFDPLNTLWLVGLSASSGSAASDVYSTNGHDADSSAADWATVSNGAAVGAGRVVANIFDGTHHFMVQRRHSDDAGLIYYCVPGGAWTLLVTDVTESYDIATANIFGGQVVITFSSDGASTNKYPRSYAMATGSLIYGVTTISSLDNLGASLNFQAASPTIMVFFQGGPSLTKYATTPDGLTWTAHTYPAAFSHGDIFGGLCYSVADQAFILTSAGTDSKTHIYISYDGLTWAEQGTGLASVPGGLVSIACTDAGCIVGLVAPGSTADPIYSTDGGNTWYFTTLQISTAGHLTGQLPSVVSSGVNFFFQTASHGRFSHYSGPSRPRVT